MNLDRAKQDLADYNYVLSMGLLISNTISGEFLNGYKFSIFSTGLEAYLVAVVIYLALPFALALRCCRALW